MFEKKGIVESVISLFGLLWLSLLVDFQNFNLWGDVFLTMLPLGCVLIVIGMYRKSNGLFYSGLAIETIGALCLAIDFWLNVQSITIGII